MRRPSITATAAAINGSAHTGHARRRRAVFSSATFIPFPSPRSTSLARVQRRIVIRCTDSQIVTLVTQADAQRATAVHSVGCLLAQIRKAERVHHPARLAPPQDAIKVGLRDRAVAARDDAVVPARKRASICRSVESVSSARRTNRSRANRPAIAGSRFRVDADCADGSWELEERSMKKSGRAAWVWVYKSGNPGGHNGNPGSSGLFTILQVKRLGSPSSPDPAERTTPLAPSCGSVGPP